MHLPLQWDGDLVPLAVRIDGLQPVRHDAVRGGDAVGIPLAAAAPVQNPAFPGASSTSRPDTS